MYDREESDVNIWIAYADLFLGLLVIVAVLLALCSVTPEIAGKVRQLGPTAALQALGVTPEIAEKVHQLGPTAALEALREPGRRSRAQAEASRIIQSMAQALGANSPNAAGIVLGASNEIHLPEKALFRSGGYDDFLHDEEARKRLVAAGTRLREELDRRSEDARGLTVVVEGHTDDEPIREGTPLASLFPTNWELSSRRATEVVRFWERECGLSPERYHIVAVGYGEHRPVVVGARTREEKQPNRRIEIRIVPAYEELERASKQPERTAVPAR